MRRLSVLLGLLLVGIETPVRGQTADLEVQPPRLNSLEAQQYATQMRQVMDLVADHYVRPVSREDLTNAALMGLYEAAQLPMPAGMAARVRRAAADDHELTRLLLRTRENVGNREALRNQGDLRASLKGIIEILDPYCALLGEEELEQLNSPERPLQGVGLTFQDYTGSGPLIVREVVLGSPAQRADFRPGDRVTHVNGASVVGYSPGPVRPVPRPHLILKVQRTAGGPTREVTLKAEAYRSESILGVTRNSDNSWNYWLDPERRIAHIRVANLEGGSADELARVLQQLEVEDLKGLILDLRWCPGGRLNESRLLADCLLAPYGLGCLTWPQPGNLIALVDLGTQAHNSNASVQYRDGRIDVWGPRETARFWNFPMIILINGESTGGAELVAAVLQDHRRATILGQRSRGKGSVQTTLDFREGRYLVRIPNLGLKISHGILVRPSGLNLHRFAGLSSRDDWGVRPDPGFEYRVSAAYSQRLKEWWVNQSLRPGASRELLPLDNPEADPQRQAALDLLLSRIKAAVP